MMPAMSPMLMVIPPSICSPQNSKCPAVGASHSTNIKACLPGSPGEVWRSGLLRLQPDEVGRLGEARLFAGEEGAEVRDAGCHGSHSDLLEGGRDIRFVHPGVDGLVEAVDDGGRRLGR